MTVLLKKEPQWVGETGRLKSSAGFPLTIMEHYGGGFNLSEGGGVSKRDGGRGGAIFKGGTVPLVPVMRTHYPSQNILKLFTF